MVSGRNLRDHRWIRWVAQILALGCLSLEFAFELRARMAYLMWSLLCTCAPQYPIRQFALLQKSPTRCSNCSEAPAIARSDECGSRDCDFIAGHSGKSLNARDQKWFRKQNDKVYRRWDKTRIRGWTGIGRILVSSIAWNDNLCLWWRSCTVRATMTSTP